MWTIERMHPETDLEGVLAVEQASFVNPWTREMFVREFQNPDVSHIYVVRADGGPVVAYCSCWLVSDELHINNVAVRPEWRRRGIGRALLRHVLHDTAQHGARRATLEVRRSNEAARTLYAGLGFEVAGVRTNYYTNPEEDALILWTTSLAA
jgi:ribosomal-protein-alanine N-acetyltransferase